MTNDQVIKKVEELLPQINELILEKTKKALNSGALDVESYENNFVLPKIILSAIGEEIKWQFKPLNQAALKARDNLVSFL